MSGLVALVYLQSIWTESLGGVASQFYISAYSALGNLPNFVPILQDNPLRKSLARAQVLLIQTSLSVARYFIELLNW